MGYPIPNPYKAAIREDRGLISVESFPTATVAAAAMAQEMVKR